MSEKTPKEFDYTDIFRVTDKDGVTYIGYTGSDDLLNQSFFIMPDACRVETLEDFRIYDTWKKSCNYELTRQQDDEIFKSVYRIIRFFMTPPNIRTELYKIFRKSLLRKLKDRIRAYDRTVEKQTKDVDKIAIARAIIDKQSLLINKHSEILHDTRSSELKALPYVLKPLKETLEKQGRAQPVNAIIKLINSLPDAGFKATNKNIYNYL